MSGEDKKFLMNGDRNEMNVERQGTYNQWDSVHILVSVLLENEESVEPQFNPKLVDDLPDIMPVQWIRLGVVCYNCYKKDVEYCSTNMTGRQPRPWNCSCN